MAEHSRTISVRAGTVRVSRHTRLTPSVETAVTQTIAAGATDVEIAIRVESSTLQSFVLSSDQPVTIETNSPSSPQEVFLLLANEPFVWLAGDGSSPIAGDVDSIFVSNATGFPAQFEFAAGWN